MHGLVLFYYIGEHFLNKLLARLIRLVNFTDRSNLQAAGENHVPSLKIDVTMAMGIFYLGHGSRKKMHPWTSGQKKMHPASA
jgi:hypothetical protein